MMGNGVTQMKVKITFKMTVKMRMIGMIGYF